MNGTRVIGDEKRRFRDQRREFFEIQCAGQRL
jgi:hypothetical protein